ncbi:hypothetical protein E3T55_06425 [Cryobacterium frigoriphilum]|uniref:Uncharacterized protein n=1 Tax=Cryobacterium frigoriphilum TaxID=1259150 RepID=A0A4R9A4P3_9MICO|nr:hypothetical protein [Cryobacterium frigoriphilum]TFD52238.1 hypothetical protein E3T55_06425 [Cryobacterium frigoriphilum]
MTAQRDDRFRRLLRWYPRPWRDAHGSVLLGTMLEQAEHEQREGPTGSETWAAVLHGLGARLDAVFAVRVAITALCCAVVAGSGWLWAATTGSYSPWGSLLTTTVSTGVVPLLGAVSVVASLRHRGFFSDARALALCVIASVAFALNLLTQLAWSLGFDAADAGVASAGLSNFWAPLVLAAWITGTMALALTLEALFARARLNRAGSAVLTGVASVVAAPVVGVMLLSAPTSAILALGAAFLAGTTARTTRREAATPALRPVLRRTFPAGQSVTTRRLIRLMGTLSALAGWFGVAYAVTGSQWSPAATDGTVGMRQGILILLIAGLPLLGALGLVLAGRSGYRRAHVWGPLGAVALSFGATAVAYAGAPDWEAMAPAMLAASAFSALAITWWMAPRLRLARGLARGLALTISVLSGLIYASVCGMLVTPTVPFAVPVVATAIAIWGGRWAAGLPSSRGLSPVVVRATTTIPENENR